MLSERGERKGRVGSEWEKRGEQVGRMWGVKWERRERGVGRESGASGKGMGNEWGVRGERVVSWSYFITHADWLDQTDTL